MALPNIKNSVGMAVTAVADSGVGTITLGAALSGGYQTAATAYGANANIDIRIEEGDTWEVCRDCTYTHSGTTVARGTLEDSSSGTSTRVAFTSAAKVYVVETGKRLHLARNRGVVRVISNGSTTQSIAASTFTKVTTALATEVVDQNGWWDAANKKFVPTEPGQYFVCVGAGIVGLSDGKSLIVGIYKNGAIHAIVARGYSSANLMVVILTGSTTIEMNGTTDYAELYVYHSDSTTLNTSPEAERMAFVAFRIGD